MYVPTGRPTEHRPMLLILSRDSRIVRHSVRQSVGTVGNPGYRVCVCGGGGNVQDILVVCRIFILDSYDW